MRQIEKNYKTLINPEETIKILEIDKNISLSNWSKDDEEHIRHLRKQPGALALLKKVMFQKNVLEVILRTSKFNQLDDVTRTQGAISAFTWLEKQLREDLDEETKQAPRDAFSVEKEHLKKIQELVTIVGGPQV